MDEQARKHLLMAARHIEEAVKVLQHLANRAPDEGNDTPARLSPCVRTGMKLRTDVQ